MITLRPSDDTYTYSNNTIRGMEDYLKVYHSTAGSQYRRITFLKFDISTVPTVVDSVVLRMYTNGWSAGGDKSHRFDAYPVLLNTWVEDDLTFANAGEKAGDDRGRPCSFDRGRHRSHGGEDSRCDPTTADLRYLFGGGNGND